MVALKLKKVFDLILILLFCPQVKAAIRTVNPKEVKYMEQEPKFKISVRNHYGHRHRKQRAGGGL